MARGNGRQHIVRDDVDRDRLLEHLGRAVTRCSWRVYAFVVMPNHLHVRRGVESLGQPASGASGAGLSCAEPDGNDQRRLGGSARHVARRERAQLDAPVYELAGN
jgi:hypothetical protein